MKTVLDFRTWLLGSYLVVFLLPFGALLGTGALATDLDAQTREDLFHQASLVALYAREHLDQPEVLATTLATAKEETLAGFRIVDADGTVVASSGDDVGTSLADYDEIRAALRGAKGTQIRPRDPSGSRKQPLSSVSRRAAIRVFVAVPIVDASGDVVGAVGVSRTPRQDVQALYQMGPPLWGGIAATFALTILFAASAGYYATRSLTSLGRAFERIGAGVLPEPAEYTEATESRITEIGLLARALQTMSDRLRARLTYISDFAGNVSHEFKTPVASLRGTLELLHDDPDMPAEQRARFFGNALADLDRMSRLVGGLLRLARAEEGAGRTSAVDLGELVASAAARAGVTVPAVPLPVEGNADQLDAVFTNLLENARVHGGAGLRVDLAAEAGEAVVRVTDDGPGISAANQARVFDRFFTTNRKGGGTGLGLALVRTIVEAHGGTVALTSEPGQTTFTVRLPLRRVEPAPAID